MQKGEEKKRKRQMSIEKKKNKKKFKNEKLKTNSKVQDIEEKYAVLFSDVGLRLEDFCMYQARGDGACGGNCTALHFHHDESLGTYVRRNVNEHVVQFWPFYVFQPSQLQKQLVLKTLHSKMKKNS